MAMVELAKPSAHVRILTLNRPERMNALSFDTVLPLHHAFAEVAADNDARAVIVTGAAAASAAASTSRTQASRPESTASRFRASRRARWRPSPTSCRRCAR